MGQHTWFLRSKELYLKENKLYDKLDLFDRGEIYLNNDQLDEINSEIDEIDDNNNVDEEYHDVFRTGKRNKDRTYIDDTLFSRKETFSFMEDPDSLIYFGNDPEEEEERRKIAMRRINEFWDKYPNGLICFG